LKHIGHDRERGELLSIDKVELGQIRPQQNDLRQHKLRNAWNTKYYNDREEFNDGQSTKYKARLTRLEEPVAVKVCSKSLHRDSTSY
jgi:hypothetical protein